MFDCSLKSQCVGGQGDKFVRYADRKLFPFSDSRVVHPSISLHYPVVFSGKQSFENTKITKLFLWCMKRIYEMLMLNCRCSA